MAKKFLTDINIAGGVYDSSGDIGSSGQVLSSTGSGINWIDANSAASVVYQDGFTGNGSTTAFTLANSIDNENKTQVYIDGVYQHKDNYSLSGTTLTFSTAPPNTSDIEVISFGTVSSADDILYDTDFGSAGLMTTNGSGVYSITTNNSSNWNTAYTYSQVGHLPLAGGTLTGTLGVGSNNINFNDGGRARFGNSSDMQIYHDGSNSIIEEHGDGNLYIRGANQVRLQGSNQSNLFIGNQGGSVGLYHNNSAKIETASYGAQIINLSNTTATSDTADKIKIGTFGSGRPAIFFDTSNTTYTNRTWFIENIGHAGKLRFGRNGKDIMEIFNDGDIYMSDNLGIGTSSPTSKLSISGLQAAIDITRGNSGDSKWEFSSDSTALYFSEMSTGTRAYMMTIKETTGNVGIGTTSPASLLHIQGSTYNRVQTYFSGSYTSGFKFSDLNGGIWYDAGADDLYLNANHANSQIILQSGGSTTLTLDASNNATFAGTVQTTQITATNGLNYLKRNTDASLQLRSENTRSGLFITKPATDTVMGSALVLADESYRLGTASYYHMYMLQNGDTYFTQSVGIGTTSPSKLLHVNGSYKLGTNGFIEYGGTYPYTINIENTASAGDVTIKSAAGYNRILLQPNTSGIDFYTGNSERMRIDSSGNVGIGTSSPTAKLTIDNGSASGGTSLKSSSSGYTAHFIANTGTGSAGIYCDGSNGDFIGSDYAFIGQTSDKFVEIRTYSSAEGIRFAPKDTERMRIDGSGNVGIGVTAPSAKLDVYRTINVTSDNDTGYVNSSIILNSTESGARGAGVFMHNTAEDREWYTGTPYAASFDKWMVAFKSTASHTDSTAEQANAKLTVTSAGNVGIGTTSPWLPLMLQRAGSSTSAGADTSYRLCLSNSDQTNNNYALISFTDGDGQPGSGYMGLQFTNHSNNYGDLVFGTRDSNGLTERMRIEKDGTVRVKTGSILVETAGQGIYLGGTATANNLDDYEEGTWTPQVYYQNATDQSNATNVVQQGKYTKIGNLVFVQFRLDFSQSSSSPVNDNIGVKNLPFAGADNHYAGGGNVITSVAGSYGYNFALPNAGSTIAILNNSGNIGNYGDQFGSGSNKYIRGSFTYLAQ